MPSASTDNRIARLIRGLFALAVILVVVLIDPYTPLPTLDIKWLLVSWTGFLAGVLWLASPWLTADAMRWPRLFGPIIGALLIFLALASVTSEYMGLNLHETRKFVSLALIFGAASFAYRTGPQVRFLMLAMCTAVALSSIYAFFQRAGMDPFPWDPAQLESNEYRNLPGSFGNPNYAAHAMVLTIVLSLYLAFGAGWRACVVFLPIFALHLFWTEQRGGLVALAVAGLLALFARIAPRMADQPTRQVVGTMLATGVVVVLGAAMVMGFLRVTTGTPYPLDRSLLIRYQAYVSATGMIIEKPVLGFGTGTYPIENPRFWTQYEQQFFAQENQINEHVHCDPLELAVDGGIPAAASYLILLTLAIAYSLFWAFTRTERREAAMGLALTAAFTAFLVDGLFGFNLRVPVTAMFLFLLLGVLEGLWRQVRAEREPETQPASWLKPVSAVALVAALLCTGLDTRTFLAMRQLQEARAWAAVGEFDAAHDRFERAARRAPWHWRIPHERAQASLSQGDVLSAAEHLDDAVAIHPHSVFLLAETARVKLMVVQQLVEAINLPEEQRARAVDAALVEPRRLMEAAIALCPYYALAHELLGRVYSTQAGELERRGDTLSREERARLHTAWPKSAEHLAKALQYGARNRQELYNLLAVARIGMRDDDGAQEALERAIASEPGGPQNWDLYLRFARYSGRYDAMADALTVHLDGLLEGESARPGQIGEAYAYLGIVYTEGKDDLEAASQAYQQAVRVAPSDGAMWRAYAEFAARHGQLTPMQAFVLALWEERDSLGDGMPPHIVALALAWQGDAESFARGAGVFSRFLLELPSEQVDPRIVLNLSWAADLLIVAAQALPGEGEAAARARMHTGIVQVRLGRPDAGLTLLQAALPELPARARIDCRVHMANALVMLGRRMEAVRELERVVELEPGVIDLWVMLARTQADAGQTYEARRTYGAILNEFDLDQASREALEIEMRALGS